jgi:hypothetical protein
LQLQNELKKCNQTLQPLKPIFKLFPKLYGSSPEKGPSSDYFVSTTIHKKFESGLSMPQWQNCLPIESKRIFWRDSVWAR